MLNYIYMEAEVVRVKCTDAPNLLQNAFKKWIDGWIDNATKTE